MTTAPSVDRRRVSYAKRVFLIFAVQVLSMAEMVWSSTIEQHWLGLIGFVGAYVAPFVGYIVALYHAPFLNQSPLLKIAALTVLSLAMTYFGLGLIMFAFLFMGLVRPP